MKLNGLKLITLMLAASFSVSALPSKPSDKELSKGAEAVKAAPPKVIFLKVDNHEFTVNDYVSFLQRNPSVAKATMVSENGKVVGARAFVDGVLIRQAMADDPSILPSGANATARELGAAYELLAAKYFPIPPVADEKTLFEYYESHKNDFGIPEMMRLSQIQIRIPEKASEEVIKSATERANKALALINQGEDFGDVAEKTTENPLAKLPKGDIGYQRIDEMPWLKEPLKALKVGDHTGVVKAPNGFEILKLTAIREGLISPFLNVRDQVIQIVRDQEQTKLRDIYVKELSKKHKIEIVQPDLKALVPKGLYE